MADVVFNIAKGRVVEFYNRVESNDPSTSGFIICLFTDAGATGVNFPADSALIDADTFDAFEAISEVDECVFTNYSRKTLTDTELSALPSPDDTNNRYDIDIPDQTWTTAGGATNETVKKFVVFYAANTAAATSTWVPCTAHDFTVTTDGSDITAQINSAGFFRAS